MIYTVGRAGLYGEKFRPLVHFVADDPTSVPSEVRAARPDDEESRRFAELARTEAAAGRDAVSIAVLILPGSAVIAGEL